MGKSGSGRELSGKIEDNGVQRERSNTNQNCWNEEMTKKTKEVTNAMERRNGQKKIENKSQNAGKYAERDKTLS